MPPTMNYARYFLISWWVSSRCYAERGTRTEFLEVLMGEPQYGWFVEYTNCGKEIFITKAPSPEEIERGSTRPISWTGRCAHCGKEGRYPAHVWLHADIRGEQQIDP